MITKETIDRIFETVRIEDVVGDFVQLKKRGVNYLGLCPFHNEKTPSFNVNPVRNIYVLAVVKVAMPSTSSWSWNITLILKR